VRESVMKRRRQVLLLLFKSPSAFGVKESWINVGPNFSCIQKASKVYVQSTPNSERRTSSAIGASSSALLAFPHPLFWRIIIDFRIYYFHSCLMDVRNKALLVA
jgi:hypothetical protein